MQTDYLGAVGLLFFLFFFVAAATEAILETGRGVLERFGATWLKSDKSLDDAVKMATEFLPAGSEARGKIAALQDVVNKVSAVAADKKTQIDNLKTEIDKLPAGKEIADTVMTQVNSFAAEVKEVMDNSERTRVFWLRVIAAIIAIGLAYSAKIDALRSMTQAYPGLFADLFAFYNEQIHEAEWFKKWAQENLGIILTGIAAASGSSYWHDKLDKVRNLKGVQDQIKKLTS